MTQKPTEETVKSRVTTDEEIDARVNLLRTTFKSEKTHDIPWRIRQLKALRAMLAQNRDSFIKALEEDTGRPSFEAWTGDVFAAMNEINAQLKGIKKWTRPRRLKAPLEYFPAKTYRYPEPLGVVLIIAPWNYPMELIVKPLAGVIAAGNCAVCKPSEIAPQTSSLLAKLIPEYLDNEAVTVVQGGIPETTRLLNHPYDKIFYTGNGRVGRIILEAAAKHLTPAVLELGGKCPAVFTKHANLDVSIRRCLWAKYYNAGQTCVAPDYVLVEEAIEEEFAKKVKETLNVFYGPDPKNSLDFGRIVNVNHFRRLETLLEGQNFFIGGETDVDDLYIAPSVIRDVTPDNVLMQDEIFGPVLPILTVPDLDAAIEFSNTRPKPLTVCLFSNKKAEIDEVLKRVKGGSVNLNTAMMNSSHPNIPFGGIGASGMGTYHGFESFNTFSHLKSVVQQGTWTEILTKQVLPPYSSFKWKLVKLVSGVD